MAEEIGFENGRNSNFEELVTLTLNPAYCRASLIDLYLHTKFHSNRKNFLWTGRMDGRTFFPSNIIRSTFGSQPKKEVLFHYEGPQCPAYRTEFFWCMIRSNFSRTLFWTPPRTRLRQYKRGQYESYTVVHVTCLTLVVYILLASRTWINAGVYCHTSSYKSILQPTSCLHNLLPPPRDPELLSRLRAPSKYPRIANRTKKYQSFISYALAHYQ